MGWYCLSVPKLQRCKRWCLGMDKQYHPTLYWTCNYLSMIGSKSNHIHKNCPCKLQQSYVLLRHQVTSMYNTDFFYPCARAVSWKYIDFNLILLRLKQVKSLPNRAMIEKPHNIIFLSSRDVYVSHINMIPIFCFLKPLILYLCVVARIAKTCIHWATNPTNDF